MAEISDIFQINITQQSQALATPSFGTALIVGATPMWAERVRTYTSADAVAEDLGAGSDEYKAAVAHFSQQPRPSALKIGRRSSVVAKVMTVTLDADLVASNTFTLTVNGEPISVLYDTDHATTMGLIALAIEDVDGIASATVGGTGNRTITVTATTGRQMSITGGEITGGATQADVTVAETTPGNTIVDDLAAIVSEDNDWYQLILTSRTEADQLEAAAWIEPRLKIFGASADTAGIKASTQTDVLAKLKAQGYNRTWFLFHQTPASYAESAWAGRMLPTTPGAATWAFKTLDGIAATTLTATERANILAKNGNTYETVAAKNITFEGKMVSGRYIDQTIFVDWLQSDMAVRVFRLLTDNDKVPFTDAGAALVESAVRAALFAGVDAGGIDPASITVTVPRVASVSTNDRAKRRLPGVTFSARLTGAIHGGIINGTVSV